MPTAKKPSNRRTYMLVFAYSVAVMATLSALDAIGWLLTQADTFANITGAAGLAIVVAGWSLHLKKRIKTVISSHRKALALIAIVSLFAGSGCTRINPGHVGIKINQSGTYKGVQDVPQVTGWVFYNPMLSNVLEYPTFVQNVVWTKNVAEGNPVNEEITFTNADSMQISVDVSLAYHIQADKVPSFYVKFRSDDLTAFTLGYLHNTARDKFNERGGKYHIEQIMGDNAQFISEVRTALQSEVEPVGVVLDQFGLIGAPRPPSGVIDAINMKVQAQQIAIQKQNELAQSQADAAKRVAQAEGEAKADVARAEGDAKSAIAHAEGDAKANQILSNSLTPNLLEWRRLDVQSQSINKWNGALPSVTGGVIPMLTIPKGGGS